MSRTSLAHAILLLGAIAPGTAMAAPQFTTLASFDGPNGSVAAGGLVFDPAGNLYGTTTYGGPGYQLGGAPGQGTVFELSGTGHTSFKTVVNFNGTNGAGPADALTSDALGNLYGTAASGGKAGTGTAFMLSRPSHADVTTLASFGGAGGATPFGGLAFYAPGPFHAAGTAHHAGDLFGTTSAGGANGDGTVFRLSGSNHRTLTTLASFSAATNGAKPGATLVADTAGCLYGTTFTGGSGTLGTVFQLCGPDYKTLTVLAAFDGTNGANPMGGLTLDAAGNLYGTTSAGGPGEGGTIFELTGPGHRHLTTLATFGNNDPDGAVPVGTLLIDAAGNLFGTTNGGADEFGDGAFLGAVFELSADHRTLTPLHAFTGGLDGDIPQAGLIADAKGNLYGTTTSGGAGGDNGAGTVFEISNSGFVTGPGAKPSGN